jgi:hypothetical protein
MGLAEIAEQVLRDAGGGPLHYREITERGTNAGLMTPTGETPWASVNAAMGVDNRRREARGELPRFIGAGGGFYRLRTAATEVEQAIERVASRGRRTSDAESSAPCDDAPNRCLLGKQVVRMWCDAPARPRRPPRIRGSRRT